MVSKKKLTLYGFDDITSYFELLLNAEKDGKMKQARALWRQMSGRQKNGFYDWYNRNHRELKHGFGLGMTALEVDEYFGSLRKLGRSKKMMMNQVKIGDLTVYEFINIIKDNIKN